MQFNDPFARFAAAKLAVAKAEAELAEAKADLVKFMDHAGQKQAVFDDHVFNKRETFTVSVRRTTSVDEDGLRKAMGARQWNKFAPRKLDKKLLETAVDTGQLDPEVVAPFISVKQGDPFITYTESKINVDE